MFFWFLDNVGEDLSESVATDGRSMNQHHPPCEGRVLQNFQNLQSILEPPSRPQEVHHTALNQEDIHATVQIKVPVLSHSPWLGTKPGEEKQKWTRSGRRI